MGPVVSKVFVLPLKLATRIFTNAIAKCSRMIDAISSCRETIANRHQMSELTWKHAYLGVVRLHNNGTRLMPTHELATDGCSSSDHAYLTYFIEPASSQSVACGLDLSAPSYLGDSGLLYHRFA